MKSVIFEINYKTDEFVFENISFTQFIFPDDVEESIPLKQTKLCIEYRGWLDIANTTYRTMSKSLDEAMCNILNLALNEYSNTFIKRFEESGMEIVKKKAKMSLLDEIANSMMRAGVSAPVNDIINQREPLKETIH